MSAVLGVQKTKYDAGTIAEVGTMRGELLSSYDSYTATALDDASTIKVCGDLPDNAKVQLILIKHPALATARTILVGTAANNDEFLAATSVATAGTIAVPCGNYVIGSTALDQELMITTAGIFNSATPLQFTVFYTL